MSSCRASSCRTRPTERKRQGRLAAALEEGAGISWAASILSLGAVVAITSVVLVILYGQTRIFFAMCRDGLLPQRLATVNARYGTPARLTIGLGVLISVLAALVPLSEIVKLVNIGTLFAFVLVNIGVIILRRTRPDMPRPYRVPWSPFLPILGVLFALYLMKDLPLSTWIRFIAWLAAGMIIYWVYGYRNSRLRRDYAAANAAGGPATTRLAADGPADMPNTGGTPNAGGTPDPGGTPGLGGTPNAGGRPDSTGRPGPGKDGPRP